MIKAVLFDLDGTLADTAPDLAYALNALRVRFELPTLSYAAIRPLASHGARGLLELGFNLKPTDAHFDTMRDAFLELYAHNLCHHTRLFVGVDAILLELHKRGLSWGIVTNKPNRLTEPLVEQLPFNPRPHIVVSGDTCIHPKPHPASLFYAADKLGLSANECLYVGDAERDIQAATAAGMLAVVARYGYLSETDQPESWGAWKSIDAPIQLLEIF